MLLCGSAFTTARFCAFPQSITVKHRDPLGFPILSFPPPGNLAQNPWRLAVSLEANGASSNPLPKLSDAIEESVSTKAFRRRITDNIIIIAFKNVDITFCL